MTLARTVLPVIVPSKTRLLATIKECGRLVEQLPEPVCAGLEKAGVVAAWRMQLESLCNMSGMLVSSSGVAKSAVDLMGAISRIVRK